MRQQQPHKNRDSEHRLRRSLGQTAQRSDGGILRIPRGKEFFVLRIIVILVRYNLSTIIDLFSPKKTREIPVPSHEHVVLPVSESVEFIAAIIATLNETWQRLFERRGITYQPLRYVTYHGTAGHVCGSHRQVVWTFYCPQEYTVYISLTLYDNMQNVFGVDGDATQEYVLAHVVGHLVQKQRAVAALEKTAQEVQADCCAMGAEYGTTADPECR